VRAPTAGELLGVWERSAALVPAQRSDALLGLALPDEDASELPVGERDQRLLELRELLFGGELDGADDCPQCGEAVEYSLTAESLRPASRAAPDDEELVLSAFGRELRLRLPTGGDLVAAASAADLDGARAILLERCVLAASADGWDEAPSDLPAPLVAAIAERLGEADPLGDVQLALACPACGCEWMLALDPGAWLWSELESWARRMIFDVHALASAYGWSEDAILALGPRRELYLQLVAG
jgi:hypothetical protein